MSNSEYVQILEQSYADNQGSPEALSLSGQPEHEITSEEAADAAMATLIKEVDGAFTEDDESLLDNVSRAKYFGTVDQKVWGKNE